jgi:predicted PurR-regulated permease PerM
MRRVSEPLSWSTIGRLVLAGFGVWVLIQTWQLWIILVMALIVASALLPAARWGDRYRIPGIVIVAGVYAGAAALLSALGNFLVPVLVEEGAQFARQLPRLLENVKAGVGWVIAWGARWEIPLPELPAGDWQGLEGIGQVLIENTLRATAGVVGALFGLLIVLILAAYLVIDAERIRRGVVVLLPVHRRERAAALTESVLSVMGAYVRGQAVVSLAVGVLIVVGLALLGVPYALLIGGVAAALNVIPFLGSPAAAVLGVLSALNISASLALWVALLFWGVNLLEGKLLVPYFVGRATGLHPVVVLFVILIGARLAGILGLLVAVPLMGGLWEVVRALYVEPMRDSAARSAASPDASGRPDPDSGHRSEDESELRAGIRES